MKSAINFVLVAAILLIGAPAKAVLIGGNFQIDANGISRFPDVTFSTVDNKYLVVWSDYGAPVTTVMGRFVSPSGAPLGTIFQISSGIAYGLLPAVTYNPTDNEFLVTWDDGRGTGDVVWGQRVHSTTGLLLGVNFAIGSVIGVRSAGAWNAATNTYLVAFSDYSEVFIQRISNLGVLIGTNTNITNDPNFSGLPAVGSDGGTQFLVTWDHGIGDNGIIRGRRINAASGAFIGSPFDITTLLSEDRSMIAFDPANSRWCVLYQEHAVPENSYDQYGRFVTTAGALTGSPIPFANGPDFEGDTLWGCDIAFTPNLGGRYLVSFALGAGQGAQEATAAGNLIGGRIPQGSGDYTSLSNAADPALNRWLTVFEAHFGSTTYIYGQLYEATDLAPPGLVTNFTTTPGSGQLTLNWTNPNDADFAGTVIRWKLGSFPAHINDGTFLVDKPNTPGSNDSYVHMGLPGGVTHYYSAFAYDQAPNYASAANTSGIPAIAGDFDVDTDVDQKDFAHLQNCFSGSSVAYETGCSDADLEADGDVDGADFTIFDGCMKGANQTPGC